MGIEFDPKKDAANIAKHGVSLAAAIDFELQIVIEDDRKAYGEKRLLAFGLLDGKSYAMAFTLRGEAIRVISLRRARPKETRRHGL